MVVAESGYAEMLLDAVRSLNQHLRACPPARSAVGL